MMDFQKWDGIFNTYAAKWKASVHILDRDGGSQYGSSLVEKDVFPTAEWELIQNLLSIHQSGFYYETGSGSSWLIAPINTTHLILLLGPLEKKPSAHSKDEMLQGIEQLTTLLADRSAEEKHKQFRKSIVEWITRIRKGEEWLHTEPLSLDVMDLIGIAFQENQDHTFHILHIWDNWHSSLRHASFQYGQGLLGYAATAGKTMVWNHIKKDPRSVFFDQHGIALESLMCFPIQKQGCNGLLFFGSTTPFIPDDSDVSLGELLADELGKQKEVTYWKQEVQVQETQIHTLSEICQVMTETDNVQQILHMIMDISLYLVKGKLCAMIWFDREHSDKAQIFARGISQERLAREGKTIHREWRRKSPPFSAQPSSFEEGVYEIPLFFRQTCYGVMLLDLSQVTEEEGFLSFFRTISIMSGMALNHVEKRADTSLDFLLHMLKAAKRKSKVDYQDVRLFLQEFARNKGWSEHITQVLLLSSYVVDVNTEFIKPYFPREVQWVLESYRNSPGGSTKYIEELSCAWAAEFIGLLLFWFEQPANDRESMTREEMIRLFSPKTNQSDLVREFIAFIDRKKTFNFALDFDIEGSSAAAEDLSGYVQKLTQLTEREREVLLLIGEGKNNKDIAQTLFISENTVKNHITNILRKLGASDRSQVMAGLYGKRLDWTKNT